MFDVKDKVVLITGAASGIGASVVRALLEEDIKHVTILDINEAKGLAIQEELNTKHGNKVKFIKCDITQERDLISAFNTLKNDQGYIDIVVNNAGIGNDEMYVKSIEINLTALVKGSLEAWNHMRKDRGGKGGTIINVASIAGLCSYSIVPVYSATKAAVLKFSTTLGDDMHYSRTGVRVIAVCFGATETSMLTKRNTGSFDPVISNTIVEYFDFLKRQSPEQAAQGVLEIYKKGNSASVWIVTNGKPAVDVTDKYVQSTQLYNDIINN